MGIIAIIGGIGLILFGVRFLRKGLDRLFGDKLVNWLSSKGRNPVTGFFSGLAAGTIAPSSTAISLLAMQMLDTGRLQSRQLLIMMLGANVGFTVIIQLVSFHLQDYAGLFIFGGVVAFQFFTRELWRGTGQCLLSLGFIFLAVGLIDHGSHLLAQSTEMGDVLRILEHSPWLVFLGVSGLTVLMQSSNATVGLGLGLVGSGLLTGSFLVPWVIGTSLGVGLTSLIAGWHSVEGRRLAVGSLTVKLVAALPLMIFPALGHSIFEWWPEDTLRQTAMFNTFFNLAVAILALAFLGIIDRFTHFLVHASSASKGPSSVLDRSVLDSPSLALSRAAHESLRLTDQICWMLEQFWKAFNAHDSGPVHKIQKESDAAERLNLEIKDYLNEITEAKSPADTRWQFLLLNTSHEMEAIRDIIDKNLSELLFRQRADDIQLAPEDQQDLHDSYNRLLAHFEIVKTLLNSRSEEDAQQLLEGRETYGVWSRQFQSSHYKRLQDNLSRQAIDSSSFYLDFLSAFRRANSHLCSIGHAFSRPPSQSTKG